MNTLVVEIDAFKKQISGYNPKKADEFHVESAKMADTEFKRLLKLENYKHVILMCGGSASGKSEFIESVLKSKNRKTIIYDGTLSSIEGAKVKIRNTYRKKKKIEVYALVPDKIVNAFIAFVARERKFHSKHFFRTHSESRATLLWICENYKDIKICIFETSKKNDELQVEELIFQSRNDILNYTESIQATPEKIMKEILP